MWNMKILFDYPMNISILNVKPNQDAVNTIQELGIEKYGPTWAWLTNNSTMDLFYEAFSGTFIIQDSRAELTSNAQPSGKQISGSVSCVDPSANISIDMGFNIVNITYLPDYTHNVSGNVTLELDPTDLAIGKLIGQNLPTVDNDYDVNQNATFIWFTITDGIIPNAKEVPQTIIFDNLELNTSSLFIGLCEHTVTFPNVSQNDASGDGMQYINPSQPVVYLPPGEEAWVFRSPWSVIWLFEGNTTVAICDDGCMLAAVWNTLLTWWGLQVSFLQDNSQQAYGMDIYCYGGVLAPVGEDKNQTCPSLDSEIWNRTLALVLDAMIQTYPKVGNASQKLFAHAESITSWQWWLQGIIPFSAFILYVACLAYTVTVYWAGETMKELDLLEVVNATHAEEERLTKSVMVGGILKE